MLLLLAAVVSSTAQSPVAAQPLATNLLRFEHDAGPYTAEQFSADTHTGRVPAGRDFGSIVNGALRVAFNEGHKVSNTGFSGHIAVPPRERYVVSFKVRYPTDFEPGLHGKQIGLSGGRGYDGGRGAEARDNGDGWSIRLQFDVKDHAVLNTVYLYHADMTGQYGGPAGAKPFELQRGQWHAIRLDVHMNTADDRADGRIRVWCDDDLKIDLDNVRFARVASGRQIDRVRLEVFPGGGGVMPSRDTWIEFDDFAWTDQPD
ncbi:MAG TPA: hypothetical protein PKB10_12185 [Tepidisphaeraceae bacterium]|nr:hypothetical protein [Tepidisphaeraceae bacterium]